MTFSNKPLKLAYTKATYKKWFEEGYPAGEEPNMSGGLAEILRDAARVLKLATSSSIIKALDEATNEAKSLRIFGSPSFVVNDEVFWGDGRLEDAINGSQNT